MERTAANGQITDSVTQAGVTLLGSAPAQGLAAAYQVGAHSTGLAMQNAIANQRSGNTQSTTTTTQAVAQILSLGPAIAARATLETYDGSALRRELIGLAATLRTLHRSNREADEKPVAPPVIPPVVPGLPGAAVTRKTQALANVGTPLTELIREIAQAIRRLAAIVNGEIAMHDPNLCEELRRATEHLHQHLLALARHLQEDPSTELWRALRDAIDELQRAVCAIEPRPMPSPQPFPARTVPVGATPPNLVIVGSGNISQAPPRIVGAS